MAVHALQGKLVAKAGQRDALAEALLSGSDAGAMPGCQLYLVGLPAEEPDTILITEIWDSVEAHRGSLALPAVREAIGRAMPLLEKMEGQSMSVIAGWPAPEPK